MNLKMSNKDFEISYYKGFKLFRLLFDNTVSWSEKGCWQACIFDSVETAKYFIDHYKKFSKNVYDVISEAQSKALKTNKGLVDKQIIDEFDLKK